MEGYSPKAYRDAGGWSIGYGHHGPDVHEGMKITQAQAKLYLKSDVAQAEACVNRNLVGVQLTQNEFNALVSMAYSRGCTGFVSSDVFKKIKAGQKTEAAQLWLSSGITEKGTGEVKSWLISRRAQEAAMFAGRIVKPVSDTAAMLPENANNLPAAADAVGGINWKAVGTFAAIGGAVWAGNKYGIPLYKKYVK